MGALIGTSLPSVITFIIGVQALGDDPAGAAMIMFMPFMIGLGCAVGGLILIGLPTTYWLKRRGEETRGAYLSTGLIGGGLITLVIIGWFMNGGWGFALFFAIFGAATGGTTGHFWWRYAREQAVDDRLDEIAEVFG